jgi:DNA-binding MarR family transcriptional regulator
MSRPGRSTERSDGAPATSGFPDNLTSMLRLTGLYRRRFQSLLADEPWVAESGVRAPTYGVLSVVKQRGPISQREVCDYLGVHASDMVELVDRLERLGWVARRRDPTDRRRYQLTITTEGRKILARYDAIAAQAEDVVLEPLTDVERRRLMELVTKVVSSHAREN